MLNAELPRAWAGQRIVEWSPGRAGGAGGGAAAGDDPAAHPTEAWVAELWRYAAGEGELAVAALARTSAPLLPVRRRGALQLASLEPLESSALLDADPDVLPADAAAALEAAGVGVLARDKCCARARGGDAVLAAHVHAATVDGVCDAVLCSCMGSVGEGAADEAAVAAAVERAFEAVPRGARDALREWLCGAVDTRNGRLSALHRSVLRSLPVFPVHGEHDGGFAALCGARALTVVSGLGTVEGGEGGDDTAVLRLPKAVVLAAGGDGGVFCSDDTRAAGLVSALGASSMTPAAFVREHVLPLLLRDAVDGEAAEEALLATLRALPVLVSSDSDLQAVLAEACIVPNATSLAVGGASSRTRAAELYDPEVPAIAALLEGEEALFPANRDG